MWSVVFREQTTFEPVPIDTAQSSAVDRWMRELAAQHARTPIAVRLPQSVIDPKSDTVANPEAHWFQGEAEEATVVAVWSQWTLFTGFVVVHELKANQTCRCLLYIEGETPVDPQTLFSLLLHFDTQEFAIWLTRRLESVFEEESHGNKCGGLLRPREGSAHGTAF
jgi:hypothetical protein